MNDKKLIKKYFKIWINKFNNLFFYKEFAKIKKRIIFREWLNLTKQNWIKYENIYNYFNRKKFKAKIKIFNILKTNKKVEEYLYNRKFDLRNKCYIEIKRNYKHNINKIRLNCYLQYKSKLTIFNILKNNMKLEISKKFYRKKIILKLIKYTKIFIFRKKLLINFEKILWTLNTKSAFINLFKLTLSHRNFKIILINKKKLYFKKFINEYKSSILLKNKYDSLIAKYTFKIKKKCFFIIFNYKQLNLKYKLLKTKNQNSLKFKYINIIINNFKASQIQRKNLVLIKSSYNNYIKIHYFKIIKKQTIWLDKQIKINKINKINWFNKYFNIMKVIHFKNKNIINLVIDKKKLNIWLKFKTVVKKIKRLKLLKNYWINEKIYKTKIKCYEILLKNKKKQISLKNNINKFFVIKFRKLILKKFFVLLKYYCVFNNLSLICNRKFLRIFFVNVTFIKKIKILKKRVYFKVFIKDSLLCIRNKKLKKKVLFKIFINRGLTDEIKNRAYWINKFQKKIFLYNLYFKAKSIKYDRNIKVFYILKLLKKAYFSLLLNVKVNEINNARVEVINNNFKKLILLKWISKINKNF